MPSCHLTYFHHRRKSWNRSSVSAWTWTPCVWPASSYFASQPSCRTTFYAPPRHCPPGCGGGDGAAAFCSRTSPTRSWPRHWCHPGANHTGQRHHWAARPRQCRTRRRWHSCRHCSRGEWPRAAFPSFADAAAAGIVGACRAGVASVNRRDEKNGWIKIKIKIKIKIDFF